MSAPSPRAILLTLQLGITLCGLFAVPLGYGMGDSSRGEARDHLKDREMLTIAYQPLFIERIRSMPDATIEVRGLASAIPSWKGITYVLSDADAPSRLSSTLERMRTTGARTGSPAPDPQFEGAWFMAELGGSGNLERRIVLGNDFDATSPLAQSIIALDRDSRLAVQSARAWVAAAKQAISANDPLRAFACAEIAARRTRLPHIRIATKDDSTLKLKAARETYAPGHEIEAVQIVIRIAEDRIALLEQKWRSN